MRAAPRTDPSVRNYRTGLLPQVLAARRVAGKGCITRARGSHRSTIRSIRAQLIRLRWLRRRSALNQCRVTCLRKALTSRLTRDVQPAPGAFQRPVPVLPLLLPIGESVYDEASSRVQSLHPLGLPQPVTPRMERGSLGRYVRLRTPRLPAAHAEAGTGPAHWPGSYTFDISRTSSVIPRASSLTWSARWHAGCSALN